MAQYDGTPVCVVERTLELKLEFILLVACCNIFYSPPTSLS